MKKCKKNMSKNFICMFKRVFNRSLMSKVPISWKSDIKDLQTSMTFNGWYPKSELPSDVSKIFFKHGITPSQNYNDIVVKEFVDKICKNINHPIDTATRYTIAKEIMDTIDKEDKKTDRSLKSMFAIVVGAIVLINVHHGYTSYKWDQYRNNRPSDW